MKTIFIFAILLFTSAVFAQTTDNQGTPPISLTFSGQNNQKTDNLMVELEVKNISNKTVRMVDDFHAKDNNRFFRYSMIYKMADSSSKLIMGGNGFIIMGGKWNLSYIHLSPGKSIRFKINLSKWYEMVTAHKLEPGEYNITIYYRNTKYEEKDYPEGSYYSNYVIFNLK